MSHSLHMARFRVDFGDVTMEIRWSAFREQSAPRRPSHARVDLDQLTGLQEVCGLGISLTVSFKREIIDAPRLPSANARPRGGGLQAVYKKRAGKNPAG